MPRETSLKETATRKKIDNILLNLGWIIDEESTTCNVTTENPKTIEQKKKLNKKEADYFLYKSGTDEILAIIEAKRPDESIDEALKQSIELYAKPLGVKIVFATDGTITETYHLADKTELKIDKEPITELLSEKDLLKFQHRAEIESPQEVKYTKQELIKVFERANDLLRKEGLREGIERFTEFANLLFLKLISELEEERENTNEPRILEKEYCWESFQDLDSKRMLQYINNTILPHLVATYNHSGDVFETKLKIENPNTLKKIVDDLGKLKLVNVDSDIKGDAFEYFLKNSVTVGNDLGEYFTPRHIVKLMVKLVDPSFGQTVYDPCCGTGGFLIEAFNHIKKKCKLSKENTRILKEDTIYGRELTGTAKIAKMNMILTGDGHTNIEQKDSLKFPVKNKYDTILTNFPFSQQTDYGKSYGFNTEDANPIFIKHVIDALEDGGKAGIITFQGVLYDNNKVYQKIRQIMVENCEIEGIIKLHNYVFQPYTSVNTSIIILKKGKPTKDIWFFQVDNDGFEKTGSIKGRRPTELNDIKLLLEYWDSKKVSEKSWRASVAEVRERGYNLNAETYKPRDRIKSKFKLVSLQKQTEIIKESGTKDSIPYIEIGDVNIVTKQYSYKSKKSISGCKVAHKYDVIISTVRPSRGAISQITEEKVCISSAFAVLRAKDGFYDEFLFYLLSFNKKFLEYMESKQQGSTYPTIKESDILNFEIPLVDKEYQRNKLNSLSKRYEVIKSAYSAAERITENLFDDMQFDGEYQHTTIFDLLENDQIQNGLYKEKSYYGSGTNIVRIDNFYNGKLDKEGLKRVELKKEDLDKFRLENGDVLLNRVNSDDFVGKCCVYESGKETTVFESNIMRIRVDTKKILPHYLVYYLSSSNGRKQILSRIKRAVNQVSVNQEDIKSIKVPVPSKEIQQKIVTKILTKIETTENLQKIVDENRIAIENEIGELYME